MDKKSKPGAVQQGYQKALDFIMVPRSMAQHMTTLGVDLTLVDMFAGIDHRPLLVDMAFALQAQNVTRPKKCFDVKAMSTPQGQAKLQRIFQNAPAIEWGVHASDHWEELKAYLVQECSQGFPAKSRSPRKTYISDELWDKITSLRQLRSELRHRYQYTARISAHHIFRAWASQCGGDKCRDNVSCAALPDRDRARRQDHAVAGLWCQIATVKRDIRMMMRDCQAEQARQTFVRAREEGPGAIAALMVSLMKSGRRYRPPATLPPIQDSEGATITDQAAVFKALGDHFARAERAAPVSTQQFLHLYQQSPACMRDALDGADIPDVADLATAFRRVKSGKAPGPSGLIPEIFRSAANTAATAIYPVFLKQLMRGETPIDFLKSFICPIPKPGKDITTAAGWRSIALQEIPHKAVSTMIRKYLVRALDQVASPLQLGGRPKGPITVPSLHALAHLRRARRMKCSAGVLYIDGVQAFYSVLRELVVGLDDGEAGVDRIVSIIEDMHDDETVRADVFRLLCGPSILEQASAPSFVQSFLRSQFHGTFFQLGRGTQDIYLTQAGTVPGAPLADILFQLALVAFHRRLQERLRQAELLVVVQVPTGNGGSQRAESSTATWVDDLAIPVMTQSAASLVPNLAKVAALAEQTLASTGVSVNYSPGKTEAMFCLRGKGANAIRKFWMIERQGTVVVPFGPGKGHILRLVNAYVHLGCRLQANGQQLDAIAHRREIAQPIYRALRRRLLFNPNLTSLEKARLVVQGPMASLLHGSGMLVVSDVTTMRRSSEAIMNMYRQSVRPITGLSCRGLTNGEVCQLLAVLPPDSVLRYQRMRLSLSIAGLADAYLVGVLSEEQTWVRLICHDWRKFHAFPSFHADGDHLGFQQLHLLFQWLDQQGPALKNALTKSILQEIGHLAEQSEAIRKKAMLLQKLFTEGATAWGRTAYTDSHFARLTCPECHKAIHGKAAMAAHRRKVHHVRSIGALLDDHTACPVCMVEFWTTSRLWMHFRKSAACLRVFLASDPDLLPSKPDKPSMKLMPATKVHGPQAWWAFLRPVSVDAPFTEHFDDSSALDCVTHAWQAFQCSLAHDASLDRVVSSTRTLWQTFAHVLALCSAEAMHRCSQLVSDAHFRSVARACRGLTVRCHNLILCTLGRECWIVPFQARGQFARLLASPCMHEEFSSQLLVS